MLTAKSASFSALTKHLVKEFSNNRMQSTEFFNAIYLRVAIEKPNKNELTQLGVELLQVREYLVAAFFCLKMADLLLSHSFWLSLVKKFASNPDTYQLAFACAEQAINTSPLATKKGQDFKPSKITNELITICGNETHGVLIWLIRVIRRMVEENDLNTSLNTWLNIAENFSSKSKRPDLSEMCFKYIIESGLVKNANDVSSQTVVDKFASPLLSAQFAAASKLNDVEKWLNLVEFAFDSRNKNLFVACIQSVCKFMKRENDIEQRLKKRSKQLIVEENRLITGLVCLYISNNRFDFEEIGKSALELGLDEAACFFYMLRGEENSFDVVMNTLERVLKYDDSVVKTKAGLILLLTQYELFSSGACRFSLVPLLLRLPRLLLEMRTFFRVRTFSLRLLASVIFANNYQHDTPNEEQLEKAIVELLYCSSVLKEDKSLALEYISQAAKRTDKK